jgi:hypothetical protein
MGKTSRRHQKLYKMKGCSKNNKSCKKYLGGSADVNLAYPSANVPTQSNPFFAYTGKGGSNVNMNAADKTIPNTGPASGGFNFLNPQGMQRGGCCGSGMQTGGTCSTCAPGFMVGGKKHRSGCKCSQCKQMGGMQMGGMQMGEMQMGGNPGIPYPNGLVGSAWTPSTSGWPGVNGVQGDSNYLALNQYKVDPQTALIATGANPPFSIGGKRSRKKRQKGGALSNFLGQDLINLGRQFQFGVGSAYNALSGFSAPVSPLPWRDQIPSASNIATIKASMI